MIYQGYLIREVLSAWVIYDCSCGINTRAYVANTLTGAMAWVKRELASGNFPL